MSKFDKGNPFNKDQYRETIRETLLTSRFFTREEMLLEMLVNEAEKRYEAEFQLHLLRGTYAHVVVGPTGSHGQSNDEELKPKFMMTIGSAGTGPSPVSQATGPCGIPGPTGIRGVTGGSHPYRSVDEERKHQDMLEAQKRYELERKR